MITYTQTSMWEAYASNQSTNSEYHWPVERTTCSNIQVAGCPLSQQLMILQLKTGNYLTRATTAPSFYSLEVTQNPTVRTITKSQKLLPEFFFLCMSVVFLSCKQRLMGECPQTVFVVTKNYYTKQCQ